PLILTGVLGVMSLEIKIPTWTRKAIGTLETVETWLPIQKVAIGIPLSFPYLIKQPKIQLFQLH
ncbi:hypothetical protein M4I23_19670, partial [Algibacter sp. L4_22]|nr:hypothetical protein [Algibacter sp. L4_22]